MPLPENENVLFSRFYAELLKAVDPTSETMYFTVMRQHGVMTENDAEHIQNSPASDRGELFLLTYRKQATSLAPLRKALQEEGLTDLERCLTPKPKIVGDLDGCDTRTSVLAYRARGSIMPLPAHLVRRETQRLLLQDTLKQHADEEKFWVVLYGMAGCGKSSLLADILHNDDANLFDLNHPDCKYISVFVASRLKGIDATPGNQNVLAGLTDMYTKLATKVDTSGRSFSNVDEATHFLRQLIRTHWPRLLLVVDDVWNEEVITAFEQLQCRILATTRKISLFNDNANWPVYPDPPAMVPPGLTQNESLALLKNYCGSYTPPYDLALKAIHICRGHPLTLSLLGALVRNHPDRWRVYVDALERQKTVELEKQLPSYSLHRSFDSAIKLSLDDLDKKTRDRFFDLVAFPTGVDISDTILALLWNDDNQWARCLVHTQDTMEELRDRSLVELATTRPTSPGRSSLSNCVYSIHPLIHYYLKRSAVQPKDVVECARRLFKRLSAALANQTSNQFSDYEEIERFFYVHQGYLFFKGKILNELPAHFLSMNRFASRRKYLHPAAIAFELYNYETDLTKQLTPKGRVADYRIFFEKNAGLLSHADVNILHLALCEPESSHVYKDVLSDSFDGQNCFVKRINKKKMVAVNIHAGLVQDMILLKVDSSSLKNVLVVASRYSPRLELYDIEKGSFLAQQQLQQHCLRLDADESVEDPLKIRMVLNNGDLEALDLSPLLTHSNNSGRRPRVSFSDGGEASGDKTPSPIMRYLSYESYDVEIDDWRLADDELPATNGELVDAVPFRLSSVVRRTVRKNVEKPVIALSADGKIIAFPAEQLSTGDMETRCVVAETVGEGTARLKFESAAELYGGDYKCSWLNIVTVRDTIVMSGWSDGVICGWQLSGKELSFGLYPPGIRVSCCYDDRHVLLIRHDCLEMWEVVASDGALRKSDCCVKVASGHIGVDGWTDYRLVASSARSIAFVSSAVPGSWIRMYRIETDGRILPCGALGAHSGLGINQMFVFDDGWRLAAVDPFGFTAILDAFEDKTTPISTCAINHEDRTTVATCHKDGTLSVTRHNCEDESVVCSHVCQLEGERCTNMKLCDTSHLAIARQNSVELYRCGDVAVEFMRNVSCGNAVPWLLDLSGDGVTAVFIDQTDDYQLLTCEMDINDNLRTINAKSSVRHASISPLKNKLLCTTAAGLAQYDAFSCAELTAYQPTTQRGARTSSVLSFTMNDSETIVAFCGPNGLAKVCRVDDWKTTLYRHYRGVGGRSSTNFVHCCFLQESTLLVVFVANDGHHLVVPIGDGTLVPHRPLWWRRLPLVSRRVRLSRSLAQIVCIGDTALCVVSTHNGDVLTTVTFDDGGDVALPIVDVFPSYGCDGVERGFTVVDWHGRLHYYDEFRRQ